MRGSRGRTSDLKIAIVGCGPAGLACALTLHRLGYRPELFERFDRAKPLGSGIILQPTGLAVLGALGLGPAIQAAGHRIDRIVGYSEPAHRRVLNVNYAALGAGHFGIAIHRTALFDVLYAAVRATNLQVNTATEIAHPGALPDFDLIIDASGARSMLRDCTQPHTGIQPLRYGAIWGNFDWPGAPLRANQLEQRYVNAHTMVGVLPLGRGVNQSSDQVALFWSLRHQDYPAWRSAGLESWKTRVRTIWPETAAILDQVQSVDQMVLAQYAHHTLRKPYAGHVVQIGDAAHATSPQLGQGANMALLDAWTLGNAVQRNSDVQSTLREYASSRRWHVRSFQFASLALTPFYQSDSRVLAAFRDFSFDFLSRLPGCRRIVAGLISGLLGNPLRKAGLDASRSSNVKGD